MRLIDADALLDSISNTTLKPCHEVILCICNAPTIDVKQMAQEIARCCKETTECTDCEFFTGKYDRMCMLSDGDFCTPPSDWLLPKDGDQHDSC